MSRRHIRFFLSIPVGALGFALARAAGMPPARCLLPATDALFPACLLSSIPLLRLAPDDLRRRAADCDEGTALIFVLAALAIAASL